MCEVCYVIYSHFCVEFDVQRPIQTDHICIIETHVYIRAPFRRQGKFQFPLTGCGIAASVLLELCWSLLSPASVIMCGVFVYICMRLKNHSDRPFLSNRSSLVYPMSLSQTRRYSISLSGRGITASVLL